MRDHIDRHSALDLRKTVAGQDPRFYLRADSRASAVRERPEPVLIERVGNSIIVVTHYD